MKEINPGAVKIRGDKSNLNIIHFETLTPKYCFNKQVDRYDIYKTNICDFSHFHELELWESSREEEN